MDLFILLIYIKIYRYLLESIQPFVNLRQNENNFNPASIHELLWHRFL